MTAIDWTEIYEQYKGLWVALKEDMYTVVASGKTVREAIEKAQKKGHKEPIMFRVPTKVIPYIGGFSV